MRHAALALTLRCSWHVPSRSPLPLLCGAGAAAPAAGGGGGVVVMVVVVKGVLHFSTRVPCLLAHGAPGRNAANRKSGFTFFETHFPSMPLRFSLITLRLSQP